MADNITYVIDGDLLSNNLNGLFLIFLWCMLSNIVGDDRNYTL